MSRPVTLFTGQWADLPFETVCQKAKSFGYDGLELACWGDHFEVNKADDAYCRKKKEILAKYGLKVFAISNHLVGQASVLTVSTSGIKAFYLPMSGVTEILKVSVNVLQMKWYIPPKQQKDWE